MKKNSIGFRPNLKNINIMPKNGRRTNINGKLTTKRRSKLIKKKVILRMELVNRCHTWMGRHSPSLMKFFPMIESHKGQAELEIVTMLTNASTAMNKLQVPCKFLFEKKVDEKLI
jgi:hypothetical protein